MIEERTKKKKKEKKWGKGWEVLGLNLINKHLLVPALTAAKPFLSSVYIDVLFLVKFLFAGVAVA